eukprot:TRINITY_DN15019_c0_g4_i1.p1 TRINITY_DN15019_c0_g4~~TRINITY_DN15019_c0_g4_i1.p1  ORF type:complete len:821 (+),score=96.95 TRINITY_DN15019_c0_g4_i1:51-2513(+)
MPSLAAVDACHGATSIIRGQTSKQKDLNEHVTAREGMPSREKPDGGNVNKWLKEKAQMDSRRGGADGDLWMVHGKWYDLSKFVESHPGGPDWIRLTKGQDVTEAFEVHHLNKEKTWKVLKSLYVKDAASEYTGRYAWSEDGFTATLHRRVAAHFGVGEGSSHKGLPPTGPTKEFLGLCAFAVSVHFLSFLLLLWCPRWPLAIVAGFTLQSFHGIGHNFLHMADNMWMYCYDFCGWKHHKHRISHALSHHLFPNTMMDLEFPEPYSYTCTANAGKNSRWVVLLGPWGMWSGPLRDIFQLWWGLAFGKEEWRKEYAINMIQLGLLMAASPLYGLALFCVMHFVCGFCIECAGFGLHRSIFCWSAGDDNAKFDYAEHCLAATADHEVDMPLASALYLFQILNNHGIHHIFPTLDKSRTYEIMPLFRETCKEFGVPWVEHTWGDIFGSLWKNWVKGLYLDTPAITTPPVAHRAPNSVLPGSKLRITPIENQSIGAVVSGVNIRDLTEEELRAVKKAWVDHCILVFRDQKLEPQEQLAFARKFPHSRTCEQMKFCGPLAKEGFDAKEWQQFKLKTCPEIQLRGYMDLKDHYGVSGLLDTGKGALEFHSDSCHEYDTPPIYTSLYCLATPSSYDATLFLDSRLAYELMTDAEKERAETLFVAYKREPSPLDKSGLRADTSADLSSLGKLYGNAVSKQATTEKVVSEVHPLVWTHPQTGKKAVISAAMWMSHIVEQDGTPWTFEDSHAYVHKLLKPAAEKRYAHKWAVGDLVCWDNRSLMHSASPVPEKQKGRLLHQIILCGDQVPVGPAGCGVGNPVVNKSVTAVR